MHDNRPLVVLALVLAGCLTNLFSRRLVLWPRPSHHQARGF